MELVRSQLPAPIRYIIRSILPSPITYLRSFLTSPVPYVKNFVTNYLKWLLFLMMELPLIPVRDGSMPPGPICNRIPILGSLPLFSILPSHVVLMEMAKRYGRIFRLKFGETNFIVISNQDLLQQTFAKAVAVGRNMPTMMDVMKSQGIIHADGNLWRTQRSFANTAMRHLGMPSTPSNKAFEERASAAIDEFLVELEFTDSRPIFIDEPLCFTLTNIFFSLIVGKTFMRNDAQLMAIINSTHDSLRSMDSISFPNYIRKFSEVLKQQKLFKDDGQNRNVFVEYMKAIVDEHRETAGQSSMPDLIDAYLQRMQRDRENSRTTFTEEHLYYVLGDLFYAGLETVAATIHWLLLAILQMPRIQENIHSELDKVIHTQRPITLEDRDSLPYLHATIMEGLRFPSILPIGVIHSTTMHSTIDDYDIPIDSTVVGFFWKIHHDPKLWPNPEEFDPMNHISASGKLNRSRYLMPFSYGRRACLGDDVAQNEIFLIFANLLHRFRMFPDEGSQLPNLYESLEGVLRAPRPFRIRALLRHVDSESSLQLSYPFSGTLSA